MNIIMVDEKYGFSLNVIYSNIYYAPNEVTSTKANFALLEHFFATHGLFLYIIDTKKKPYTNNNVA